MWIITSPTTLIVGILFVIVVFLEGAVWLITQWWFWALVVGGGVVAVVSRK